MTETTRPDSQDVADAADAVTPAGLEAGVGSAAAFADAETREILNLLGASDGGGSCCGGSCCA